MQRVRYRTFDGVHWGEVEGGMIHQLTSMLGRRSGAVVPLTDVSLLPPCEPRAIVCVGKNYAKHAAEMGGDVPDSPVLFMKPPTSVIGPLQPIRIPSQAVEVHHEAELAVVIANVTRNVAVFVMRSGRPRTALRVSTGPLTRPSGGPRE